MILVKFCAKGFVTGIVECKNCADVLHKVVSPSTANDGRFSVFFKSDTTVLEVLSFGLEAAKQLHVFNAADALSD